MRNLSLVIFIMLLIPALSMSQEKSSLSVGTDVVSRYVWRGLDFGNSPSIQPSIEYSKGKFTAGFWGSYATNGANVQEADLYLSYTPVDAVTFTITDYFFPDATVPSNKYFNYDDEKTGHVFEGMLSFNGTENIPVTLTAAMNFYGADARKAPEGDEEMGDLFYSTYVELGYSTELHGTPIDFFIGASLTDADEEKDEIGFYANDPGIINLGMTASKDIKISDSFTLPLSTSLIFNPEAENVFMVLGISL